MGTDEADAGGVEQQADGHASFVACGTAHPGFHSINSDIPENMSNETLLLYIWLNCSCSGQLPSAGGFLPDEGCVLWSDEHKQAHSDKLLRCQQHVLMVPRDVFLKLSSPKFLVCGAVTNTKW